MQASMNSIIILYFIFLIVGSVVPKVYKLEQLQVLFRHGDRTPGKEEIFENDPYDDIYKSYGYGELTKIGIEREHQIGELLRQRYATFLEEYHNGDVYAISTALNRTKMSLQLVLKGLYPMTTSDFCNHTIDCQSSASSNNNFFFAIPQCSTFNKLYSDTVKALHKSVLSKEDKNFLHSLEEKSGINITTFSTAWPVYDNLRSARSLGLPLPNGFCMDDFNKLEKIMVLVFKAMTYTEQMKRIMIGPLVKRFLKIFNDEKSQKKIYLYSGHETNIAAFINAHNISGAPDVPDYGSTLILEKLSGSDNRKYIRVYLWTGVSGQLMSLRINHCKRTCPLSDYEKIVQAILPNELSKICTSSSENTSKRPMESTIGYNLDLQLAYLFAGFDLRFFKYMKDFSMTNLIVF